MEFEPAIVKEAWELILDFLETQFNKRPADLESVLFLIGVQELGHGHVHFTKEQKQDLMHIAICKVLSFAGFYEIDFIDQDGWPHWKLIKELPSFDILEHIKLSKSKF